jgi:membrane-bound serine protease (ClpP class)
VWTGIATVSFVIGSLTLYDGISLSWITLLAGIAGMTVAMLTGMPAMVRARFSTPTIGREWMIGEEGSARTSVSPEGVVEVRGAPWRARTNRATPIGAGDPVRVAAIDGLVLDVEPLTGAARDYRERRSSHPS